jgi:hypothetical protein
VLLPTPPFWLATAMIRVPSRAPVPAADRLGVVREAFEERCAAVRPVPDAFVARVVMGFGLEDERAREEEAFVTDES